MKKVLSVVLAAAIVWGIAGCSGTSTAENTETKAEASDNHAVWPTTKTVEIICPASAGGLTDGAARIWANYLSTQFPDTNFIVNNDNTGNGTVAMEAVRNATELDGSTILFYNTGMLLANYTGAYKYSLFEDFNFCTIGYSDKPDGFMLCVEGTAPYKTVDELVAEIEANPGKIVTGIQNGSTRQFLAGAFKASSGGDFKMVDTGAEADTVTSLLGGNIQFAFVQASNAKQYAETGDMRILGICQQERSENYPDIPTLTELGYDGMDLNALQIIAGPKGMSDDIAEAIAAAMEGYANDEAVQKSLANLKVSYTYTNRADSLEMVKRTNDNFANAAKALGY